MVATVFTSMFSESVKSLVLVAPGGLLASRPITAYLLNAPFVSAILTHRSVASALKSNTRSCFTPAPTLPDSVRQDILRHLDIHDFQLNHIPGFVAVFRNTIRYFPIHLAQSAAYYRAVGKVSQENKMKVLVIWVDLFSVLDGGKGNG